MCPPGHNHAAIEAWSSADLGQLVYGYTPNKTYIQNKYLKLIIFKYNINLHKLINIFTINFPNFFQDFYFKIKH